MKSRKRQKKQKQVKSFFKVLKSTSAGLLLLCFILSQVQLFNAFEAHVINVTATIHKLDNPVFYPAGQSFCTMEEGVDIMATDPDDAPVIVHYEVGTGTLDPSAVPDPTCSSPAGSNADPSVAHINITQTDTVIKAVTCTADGLHQGQVITELYHFDQSLCPCNCEDLYITNVQTGSNFNYGDKNIHIQNGGEIRGSCDMLITTNCNLIIEEGGKITHNGSGTNSGKNIKIVVGKDMTVNGKIQANGGSGTGTQTGGKIEANVTGNISVGATGVIEANAENNGGQVILKSQGSTDIAQGGKVMANSSTGEYGDNGGLVIMEIGNNLTINGQVQANGQADDGGRVIMSVVGEMSIGQTGYIEAKSQGNSDTDNGGQIALKVAGQLNNQGEINASGVKRGGIINLWSADNITFSSVGEAYANGGSGTYTQYGGRVYINSHKKLTLGMVEAKAQDVNGSIELTYCAKDFGGASFNPVPAEITSCPSDIILNEIMPNPLGSDTGFVGLPLDGEWVELYNRGASPIDVNGWYLYDNNNSHALPINSSRTSGGTTIIPAGGLLTVYRNGDSDFNLDNDGDKVRLYNGSIGSGGILMDSFTYIFNLGENNSYARIPDGSGPWYDPEPTPGLPNILNDPDYTTLWSEIGLGNEVDPEEPVEPAEETINEIQPIVEEPPVVPVVEEQPVVEPSVEDPSASNLTAPPPGEDQTGQSVTDEQPVNNDQPESGQPESVSQDSTGQGSVGEIFVEDVNLTEGVTPESAGQEASVPESGQPESGDQPSGNNQQNNIIIIQNDQTAINPQGNVDIPAPVSPSDTGTSGGE